MAVEALEVVFRNKLAALKDHDKKSMLFTKDEYFSLIEEVKIAGACADKTKTWRQYCILKRYEVMQFGDVEKLIKKRIE